MKRILLISVAAFAAAVRAVRLDGVAAQVDHATITVGDVVREMQRRRHPTYEEALASLVDRKLILKEAAIKKMEMQEWVVDNRIREIVHDTFGDDRNKLDEELRKSRVTMAEWRDSIREDMIVNAMRWQLVDKNLAPTPGQMRKEYAEHPERYVRAASTDVRVILLRPADGADGKPGVKTRAEEILERLGAGADFAALAREHSSDSHAKDGGLWKDVNPHDAFRAEVADAILALKTGAVSQLIMLDGWGFIVKKERETAAGKLTFNEAYEDIVANVRRAASRKAYEKWIGRLKSMSYVKTYPAPPSVK